MAIFRLIPANDLKLENGDFVWIDGLDHARQNIASRFQFFLGEWFLNVNEGVPYYEHVLKKNPDKQLVRSIFRAVLKKSPEVISIDRFEVVFDESNRSVSFSFQCKTEAGTLIVAPEDRDFVLEIFS